MKNDQEGDPKTGGNPIQIRDTWLLRPVFPEESKFGFTIISVPYENKYYFTI